MFGWFRFQGASAAPAADHGHTQAVLRSEVTWRDDGDLPIPDWSRHDRGGDDAASTGLDGIAAAWLDALCAALPPGGCRIESAHFMVLSWLEPRAQAALLAHLERSRRRILAALPGISADADDDKIVVLVLPDEDAYYRYIAHYGESSSEPEAFSGGMFIDHGHGHFVFAQGPLDSMEPVVVHELAHCLVRHLPLPAWLNEGLAVNTEQRFSTSRSRYRAPELQYLFDRFWNASTIQEFWSGKSFLRPDDGQPLSYELARVLVELLDKDYPRLAAFCATAHYDDAGAEASRTVLGASLQELVEIVLGPGDWQPRPEQWAEGTEQGQFRPA